MPRSVLLRDHPTSTDEIWTRDETAQFLRVSPHTLSGIVNLLIILPNAWHNHPSDDPSRIDRTAE